MAENNYMSSFDESAPRGEEYNLFEYIEPLLRSRWELLLIFLTAIVLSSFYNYWVTPLYRAQSSVIIRLWMSSSILREKESEIQTTVMKNDFNTKIKMIKSLPLGEELVRTLIDNGYFSDSVKDLDPAQLASFVTRKAHSISGGINTENPEETNIVQIQYTSSDPVFAKDVVNYLADTFVESDKSEQLIMMNSSLSHLQAQVEEAKLQVEEAEQKLYEYRLKNNIFEERMDKQALNESRADLKQKLIDTEKKRRGHESKISELKNFLARKDFTKYTPILPENEYFNECLLELRRQLVAAEMSYERLEEKYLDKHPDVIRAQNEIDIIKNQFEQELKINLARLVSELNVIRSEEDFLRESLSRLESSAILGTEKDIDYVVLEREASSARDQYRTLLSAIKEVNVNANSLSNSVVYVHEKSSVPASPFKPNKMHNLMLGMLLGLTVGGLFAYGREFLDLTVRSPADITKSTSLPVLSAVPLYSPKDKQDINFIISRNPKSIFSESLASLRTCLKVKIPQENSFCLVVTSSGPREGKTLLASNLGLSMAQDGKKVVVLDADLHNPNIHKIFKQGRGEGVYDIIVDGLSADWSNLDINEMSVGDILHLIRLKQWSGTLNVHWNSLALPLGISFNQGNAVGSNFKEWKQRFARPGGGFPSPVDSSFSLDPSEVGTLEIVDDSGIQALDFISKYPRLNNFAYFKNLLLERYVNKSEFTNLHFITAGGSSKNPHEILGSKQMQLLLKILREEYDWVIIDSPPAWPLADVSVLCPVIDGLLWITRAGETQKKVFKNTVQQIQKVNPVMIGVVINAVDLRRDSYYYYGYSHYYYRSKYYRNYYHEQFEQAEEKDKGEDVNSAQA